MTSNDRMMERGGEVRATVSKDRSAKEVRKHVKDTVQAGSAIFSDEWAYHWRMDAEYEHKIVNHAVEYVRENIRKRPVRTAFKRGTGRAML